MNSNDSEQTELLRNIWQEMKALGHNLGSRIDQTNSRLDQTNERLDQTNERLDQTNERLDQGFETLGRRIDELGERIDNVLLGEHREEHERLRERVTRLERHVGLTTT